ncbi:RNA-dependent RNA polymerase [Chrysothrix chrysovirus 1]|uniref:RNA-directed RNA polymerase n=1 Tax=Chrysothrix chrysovirus 1 TaxID=2682569 RepID=A0A650D7Z2_9VIRU|nr:RNA-dependent RNA polymerase [Chrysothrix chrysovirus 1]QGR26538.1 RNA-dependent RNA polymerase [Chrysothrix chrysovirus 1]
MSHYSFDHDKTRPKPSSSVVELRNYVKGNKHLGFSKTTELQIENSLSRYDSIKRDNLFAVVMRAGCGKSHLAYKYGLLDIDEMVSDTEHDQYMDERDHIMAGKSSWSVHNNKWMNRVNKTLDLLDYSMPLIIFVHTEEAALELGARPIAFLKLSKHAHNLNIRSRKGRDGLFSVANYELPDPSDRVPNKYLCDSNSQLEAMFLRIMNISGLPVAGPFQYSKDVWNTSYSRDVPDWILRGTGTGSRTNIKELVSLFDCGKVPKECVDYYVRHSNVPTQFDFGVSMWEWIKRLAPLPQMMNDKKKFNVNDDMMDVFPPKSQKEKNRLNVTIKQLQQTFDIFGHDDIMQLCEHHVGESQVFVTSLISAWKGIVQDTKVCDLVFDWFLVNEARWSDCMKSMHSLIRTSRFFMNTEISESERQKLMYLDLLIGRGEYKIDEMKEVELRSSDTYNTKHLSYDTYLNRFTNQQYKADLDQAIQLAHNRIKLNPKKINVMSFMDFYNARASWLTKGGLVSNTLPSGMKKFVSQVIDPVANIVSEIQGRHNKKSLFEVSELWEILDNVNDKNFNITKTLIKFETGKKDRTLLPGSLAHFIVFTYVLELAEKQEQIGSVRLNAMGDVDIRYFDKKMSTGIYHVLYDWADFNEQHSADEMASVIRQLGEVVPGHADYSLFVEAIVEGMYSMGLEDRDGVLHKLWSGLFSGWRGTTWVNSTLNFCYESIALLNMERISGYSCVIYIDHGGDDIDLALSEPSLLPNFLEIMDSMLFKANKWKQMFGTRSEFFRNTVTGVRVYASQSKAIPSFIAGDWEGAGKATVKERAVSLLDQIGKLMRRGVNKEMCQGFAMSAVAHWCKVKDGEEWVNLPQEIIHGREEDGGIGMPDRNNEVWELEEKVPELNEEWYRCIIPGHKASSDYVGKLAGELDRFSIVIEQRERLAQRIAEDSYDIDTTIDREAWKKLLKFKSNIKRKHKVVEDLDDDIIYEGFMDMESTEGLDNKYNKAGRYQEFIQYLSFNNRAVSKEELAHIMSDGEVSLKAIEFQGNIYYSRLVPEFIAHRAILYCKEIINKGIVDSDIASYVYNVICSMSSRIYRHEL